MSTNSVSSLSPLNDLAATITRKFDKDQDGRLSVDEFAGVLSQLLGGATGGTLTNRASSLGLASEGASATRTPLGNMGGFDLGKLANLDHRTTKYEMGRIFQFYPNTPAGLRDALPEIQQLVPGVRIVGTNGDKLDFGDYVDPEGNRIGIVDVLQAAAEGGKSWHWIPVE